MSLTLIDAPKACASVGPYSQRVRAGNSYYLCGQVPFHPVTGEVVGTTMKEQAEQTLANLKAVLDAAGLSISDIAKTTVFVTNLDDFDAFNAVYAAFMGSHRPARVLVEVSNIAHGCLLEMDAVCYKD
jgi:2-iminobutanoate/2-iminopropanoate deaminase